MIEIVINAALTGIGTGLGVAVGTYLSNKMVIGHLQKIEKKLKIPKEKKIKKEKGNK